MWKRPHSKSKRDSLSVSPVRIMRKRSLSEPGATDNIWHHPFMQKATANIAPAFREEHARLIGKTGDIKKPPLLSLQQLYHREVFNYAGALCSIPQRLETLRRFLENIPSRPQLDRLGLGRKDYIIYHYEKYILVMVSVPDIALNLVNSVFNLGFPMHQAREHLLLNNNWIKASGTAEVLKRILASVKELKSMRNMILHHGEEPVIEEMSPFFPLETPAFQRDPEIRKLAAEHRQFLKKLQRSELRRLSYRMEKERKILMSEVSALFGKLLPVYDMWTDILSLAAKVEIERGSRDGQL